MSSGRESKVVIVGGGLAGHRLAYRLQHKAEVTLVDPKDHFEVPMAAPRLLVQPELLDRAMLPFHAFLPAVRHVAGHAVRVAEDRVHVRRLDGLLEVVAFDRAVLAVGSRFVDPLVRSVGGDRAARTAAAYRAADAVRAAKRVLVVGGGAVGVEIAAELAVARPDLDLTLVHGGERVLDRCTQAASRQAERFLVGHGVRLLLGARVHGLDSASLTPGAVRTEAGELLSYDLRIDATGASQNAHPLVSKHHPDALGDKGRLAVDPHLRLVGSPHVYAVGDITDLPESRLGRWAGEHVDVVATQLEAWLADPEQADAEPGRARYVPHTGDHSMLVTLGPRWGTGHVAQLGPAAPVAVPWLTWALKSRDMMVGRYRKGVGLL